MLFEKLKISMTAPSTMEKLLDLYDEILEIQRENSSDISSLDRVQEIFIEANRLVPKLNDPEQLNEILMHGKIRYVAAEIVTKRATARDTGLKSFDEDEYIEGILNWVEKNSNESLKENSWECLAPVTYNLYSKSTPATYMLGLVSLQPVPVKEKTKVERQKKIISEKTKIVGSTDVPRTRKKNLEESFCEHLLKSLRICYKQNNEQPILFLNFIINPMNYWCSIENIFYFSFLVRDGYINMYLNENNLPVIEPISKNVKETKTNGKQFCFSLSKKDWQRCIQKFNITSTMVKPFQMNE